MRPQPNIRRVFEILPQIMHLPLIRHRDEWWGACYINGARHARQDKMVAKIYMGRILVLEQGGDVLTIENWLMKYGGAANYPMALDILNGECDSMVMASYTPIIASGEDVKYIDKSVLANARSAVSIHRSNLFKWLCKYYDESKVIEVFNAYNVTVDEHFNTVFWYVNKDGLICKDKVIRYGTNGKRDKLFGAKSNFHKKDGYTARCYFGAHLKENKEIGIVESEKTALICALEHPERTWLASGGATCLGEVEPDWLLYADNDKAGRQYWEERYPNNRVQWYEGEEVEEGNDIGDLIIEKKRG